MANATLTNVNPVVSFDTVPGGRYVFGATGNFGPGLLRFEFALAAAPSAFEQIRPHPARDINVFALDPAPGGKFRVSLDFPDSSSAVTVELTEA